jgi:uncharacterized membrane protein (GlpM family)
MGLRDYVRRRNGVPLGAPGSMRNMFSRSFGASSFAGFWRYWNPIFGYGLGRYVFAPLKGFLPPAFALIATFVVCGALHDLVTMAVRGSWTALFTPWFFFLGAGVVLGNRVEMNLSAWPWAVRAGVNIGYLAICLALALGLRP